MEQTIIALIRPRLNFAIQPSQAAHFIEHILISPQRFEKMGIFDNLYAKNVIMYNGWTTHFYMAEYFIVERGVAGELAKSMEAVKSDLFLDKNFDNTKAALVQELLENNGEFISLDEQLARAILAPDSPSIQNKWHDLSSVNELTHKKITDIFRENNTDLSLLTLSFDEYKISNQPRISKDKLRGNNRKINIYHPWLPDNCTQVLIAIPLPEYTDQLTHILYRRSLTDYKFGLLFNVLRNENGIIYDLSAVWNSSNNTMEISFSLNEENYQKGINLIKNSLHQYKKHIDKNLHHLKDRLQMEYRLDWGDIQNQRFVVLDEVILGNLVSSPSDRIKKMDQIDAQALVDFNNMILELLETSSIIVKSNYGEKPRTVCSDK